MTDERKEIVEVLLANRLYLYSLLHKCFGREADPAQLELLSSEQTGQSFALLGGEVLEKVPSFLAELRKDLKEPDFLDQVKSEYMRLFVGPGRLIAPPWESVYLGDEAMLFQDSTLKVRETYRAFGLQAEAGPRVPDDSLALELAFMSALAERSLHAFQGGNRESLRQNLDGSGKFLREHLLQWVPALLERMTASPTDALYPQLCLILDSFLKKDEELLAELMHECSE